MSRTKVASIEPLESRRLFAGVHLSHHILVVTGASAYPDTITVGLSPDGLSVVASLTYPTAKGIKSFSGTYPLTDYIRAVTLRGGAKADDITVDQTFGSFTIPTRVLTYGGNDVVVTGDERDSITNSSGNDYIDSGAGNDTIHGGPKHDTLIGGAGNDKIYGGRGVNLLEGGAGNDTLYALAGHDTLYGQDGNDVFAVRALNRHPTNDYTPGVDVVRKIAFTTDDSSSVLGDILNGLTWPF